MKKQITIKLFGDIEGLKVPIVSRPKFIINKKASEREKDSLDELCLENSQRGQTAAHNLCNSILG